MVSSRWCGVTSAVTGSPRALAQRSTSTVSAVETWQTCSRDRVSPASWTSRATMLASAAAGQPGRPSRPEISPSWQQASGPASCGSWACWAMHAVEGPDVLQRPAHQPGVGDAAPVVGEHPYAGAGPGHQAQLGQLGAGQALAHRADRDHLGGAVPPAQRGHVLGGLGGVGHRGGVGHGQHRGVTRRGPPPGCRSRPSPRPPGRARAGGCAGRPVRAGRPARRRRSVSVPGAASAGSTKQPVADQQVGAARRRPGRRR